MPANSQNPETETPRRMRLLRLFLWFSLIGSGIGLGAKLFDLLVLAGAWGASPPESLTFLPYGKHFPLNPGDFFIPLTLLMIVGTFGALVCGWKTPFEYRIWLLLPAVTILLISVFTPILFWPMIGELYGAAVGRITRTDAELMALVRKWFILDGLRIALIAAGFVSYIRAISLPIPKRTETLP